MTPDITLVCVNWNNRPCLELMLKSYVKHHYDGIPLNLLLWDNDSQDDSKQFYAENGITFQSQGKNKGHENSLDILYQQVKTRYCLIVDSDIIFNDNCWEYIKWLNQSVVAVGDYINGDQLGDMKIKPRLAAWFILFDIQRCKNHEINHFRHPENTNSSYDVGSEFYENLCNKNLGVYALDRFNNNPDGDLIGHQYGKFDHLLRMSWDLSKHGDRRGEIERRQKFVLEKLKEFDLVDLKNKFI